MVQYRTQRPLQGIGRERPSGEPRHAGAPTTDPVRVAAIRISLEVGLAGPASVMETEVSVRNHRRR